MLLTLIGPERFLVAQALGAYLEKYSTPDALGDLNLTRLDGARTAPEELARSVQSMGFFSDRRVVVVEGLLTRFGARSGDEGGEAGGGAAPSNGSPPRGRGKAEPGLGEAFAQVLSSVPDSTVLILVERGSVPRNNLLLKAATRHGKVEEYLALKGVTLERWIKDRAASLGLRITSGAQTMLASGLGDLQAIASELDKLSLYLGEGGTVDEEVLRLVSYVSKQDDVFEMTSAVARRDTRGALQQLHRLMDGGTAPEGILPVLAWQIRTLIQVRDMLDRRVPEGRMADAAGLSDYVVRKSVGQARQFTMAKLLEIHGRLVELDHAVKTGRAEAEMTLDALVVEMCH